MKSSLAEEFYANLYQKYDILELTEEPLRKIESFINHGSKLALGKASALAIKSLQMSNAKVQ